jgi:MFS transporter, ACS family, tartrate transporter
MIDQTTGNAASDLPDRVMRKAQLRLLPFLLIAYLIAIVDRINISFAAETMNADLGFTATVYGFAGGIFFISYALLEVPSNMAMMRFGTRLWVTRIMISWGILSAALMFVTTPMQYYVLRFLLGAAEAGFFPAILYYASIWFPTQWRARVVSRFYVAQPITSIVMGLISPPILGMEGVMGLHGWQWLFLIEGVPAVVMGIIIFRYLPDSPAAVTWLAPDERRWLTGALAADAVATSGAAHGSVLRAIFDPKVLLFGFTWFFFVGSVNAYYNSMPSIIAAKTGMDISSIGQLTVVGGVIGVVMLLGMGWHSDRRQERYWHMLLPWTIVAGAFTLLALATSPTPALIAAMLIFAFWLPSQPAFFAALSETLHERHRAVGIAAVNTIAQFGAFLSTSALGVSRDATGSYDVGLAAIAACVAVSVVLLNILRQQR